MIVCLFNNQHITWRGEANFFSGNISKTCKIEFKSLTLILAIGFLSLNDRLPVKLLTELTDTGNAKKILYDIVILSMNQLYKIILIRKT